MEVDAVVECGDPAPEPSRGLAIHRVAAGFIPSSRAAGDMCMELLKKRRYAVVHDASPALGFPGGMAAVRAGVPWVAQVDEFWAGGGEELPERPTGLPQRTIVSCAATRRRIAERWEIPTDGIEVFPGVVDTDLFTPEADTTQVLQRHSLEGRSVAAYAGAVHPGAGVDALIRAAPFVWRMFSTFKLLVIGGSAEAILPLQRLLGSHDVGKYVEIVPSVPEEELAAYLCTAGVAVAPYPKGAAAEPQRLMEYMACGRAIVATNLPWMRDIIRQGKNGMLVPPGDEEALASAVIFLLSRRDVALRIGEAARRDAVERFGKRACAGRLRAIYAGKT